MGLPAEFILRHNFEDAAGVFHFLVVVGQKQFTDFHGDGQLNI